MNRPMNPADTVFDTARRLQQAGTPYALVSVIKALAPASARPGDKAIVTAEGDLHGWVGGGCAQPAVIRSVRQALADGRARVIRIAPTASGHERELGDVLEFGMACHSGGTLERIPLNGVSVVHVISPSIIYLHYRLSIFCWNLGSHF